MQPKPIATTFAAPRPPTRPPTDMAELMNGFASIPGPQILTPRYVNTPSRHCMSRKATTAASPKRLPGASHRLTKPAIRCPQEGEVAAYFPLRQPPCGGAIKSSAAETGAGARDWGWGGG